ncbi:[FeFe] hydrogenase H-cluster radical SAM maturase HydE [Desulfoluna limicola]|uniref:[FeFe] hydrogenase H-cluster radical SAM maturase HydE n=1 Tax=Desulfoluna limicola TaxID=2810562 RepID=A0ABN6FAI2_9BACT|nr:[FeFe] hydrogenase H-cluster radical SAM maturase HydE [Desulfoluna limicola]BCS98845.1 [FeFe] hydrogenase H-cluster radical SAM maturase HydE [Desulfoluna limicola]
MTKDEIIALLEGKDDAGLFERAAAQRLETFGEEIYLRGIVEFSSYCRCQCNYCGLRGPNNQIHRYRLSVAEILDAVDELAALGLPTVVLQGGEDPHFDVATMGRIVQTVKKRHKIAVTLSLGERGLEAFSHWRDCGADRYLLKMETMNPALYPNFRPGCDFDQRLASVRSLQALGYEAGSGIITGLPGMTLETLADDILAVTELGLDMISAGPFVPHQQTPFGGESGGDPQVALRTMAILRLLNPNANIPATSALETVKKEGRKQGIEAGANVLMFSVTPETVRKNYAIYPGKNQETNTAAQTVDNARNLIQGMGLKPSISLGGSKVGQQVKQVG